MTDVVAGRFALCDPIARGGSGTVWRAFDRKRQVFCAAKVLRRRDAGDLLRFVREQSVRMSHDHVLTPYSWAAEDAHVVIASELVDGGSVHTLINDYGPLSPGTVAVMLDQLLEALEQVHGAGLVHRDVKPANLLLRATGTGPIQLMLSDFGLALGADDAHLTQVGTVVGTPGYLAPELVRGDVGPSVQQDLFAAGRVAAALASGVEPAQLGEPTDVSSLPPGRLRDVVASLGSVDPSMRPSSAQEARAWLRDVPRDPVPRTRDGDAIDVLHQLPPLPQEALVEAGAVPGAGPSAAPFAVPAGEQTIPPGYVTGPPQLSPGAPYGSPPVAAPSARRRRVGLLLAAAAVVVAAGVSVPLLLASGDDAASPQPRPSTTPTATTGGSYDPPGVTVNQICSFTDEGDRRAAAGGTVRCARTADGTYVWVRD
ncbi:serine/threonine-protein kinase [Jatrophihabitans fulvus]